MVEPTHFHYDIVNSLGDPDTNYWHANIDESAAAAYLDVSVRTIQAWRVKGGGPKFIRQSARSIKYRRIDLKVWQDSRLAKSTSDTMEANDGE